ncbi:hydrolase [Palaeococcus pacificus DY20341]|uniref:Hydrolase n=1 Tax=Palaeococcus pacificus DY20341 TaxID=1343739 RepID=A0A075LQG7_9EURY|nr:HAD family hydrolase [Palaeococcus pacificus]AIF68955.1 hydrolase [Palaeococcus pacificus DY20341]
MIIAFDYDGTLVDSYSVIEGAFRGALEKHFSWLPLKGFWAKILTKIELYFEKPKFGKHSGNVKQPFFFKWRFFRTWFEERARLTKPLDDSKELLRRLKEEGHIVISFSAEDFVDGMKEHRLKLNGFYKLFDDVIVFGREITLCEAFQIVREKYGDEIFIWVDDKPWRFIGRGDENTEYVWYYFPMTGKYVDERTLDEIPHLHVIQDLWSIFDVIKRVEAERANHSSNTQENPQ